MITSFSSVKKKREIDKKNKARDNARVDIGWAMLYLLIQ